MLQFFNNQQRNKRARDEFNQPNGWISTKVFNQENHRKNYHESSPSFVTDENIDEGLYIADSFTLTSDHSVSEYGESIDADFQGQRFKANQIQNSQQIKQIDGQVSFFASLQSSPSYNPSIELLQSQFSAQVSLDHNESIEKLKNISSKVFLPEIKSLVQQINLLENDLYEMAREYLRMKTFSQSVIVSVKTLLSQEVGKHLQEYMQRQFKNCQFEQFDGSNIQGNNKQKLHQNFSQNLLTKLKSQQLSYTMGQQSRQMSKNIEEIFTLGSSKFKLQQNFDPQPKSKLINCKSTQKKNVPNFRKNPSQKDKENVCDQTKVSQKISQKKAANKSRAKQSQIEVQKMKNESMKFLTEDDSTCTKSTKASTPRNFLHISLSETSVIATQLLCEVCKTCFQPNEFFQHLSNCSASQSSSSLKSTSKLAFNYTIMMQKLFGMRQEIESQIELLSLSKQKHNEKAQRQRLKKKLEEDLNKVTKIIEEKQKQMEIHLSKNIGIDIFSLKDSLPIQGKMRKNYH